MHAAHLGDDHRPAEQARRLLAGAERAEHRGLELGLREPDAVELHDQAPVDVARQAGRGMALAVHDADTLVAVERDERRGDLAQECRRIPLRPRSGQAPYVDALTLEAFGAV